MIYSVKIKNQLRDFPTQLKDQNHQMVESQRLIQISDQDQLTK